jgi:hypothetical protein
MAPCSSERVGLGISAQPASWGILRGVYDGSIEAWRSFRGPGAFSHNQ